MASDPLSLVYNEIIKELSRIDFLKVLSWNTSRDPELQTVSESDLPEVQLVPTDKEVLLGNASCGTFITQNYSLIINTGDNRLGEHLFPVEWALLLAMHRLQYGNTLDALQFESRNFVIDTAVVNTQSGLSDPSNNRGINGWTALWAISVKMSFPLGT